MDVDDFLTTTFWVDIANFVGALLRFIFNRKGRSFKDLLKNKQYSKSNQLIGNLFLWPVLLIGMVQY